MKFSALSSLNQTILRLAVPTILMNISLPLLGAVDTAVVGHLENVYEVGAVSLGSLIFTIIFWACSFFRMSTVGLAAQAQGREDSAECADVLGRGLLLGGVLGAVMILLAPWISQIAFFFINASAEVEFHANEYFLIRVYGAPAAFITMVFTGWFYGLKNILYPVILTIFVNAVNVVLDFWFVWGLGYHSAGVAWASLIAHYLGAALLFLLFFRKYRAYWHLMVFSRLIDATKVRTFMSTNFDIFLRSVSILFANTFFMAKSAALGDVVLAVNTILVHLQHITAYAMDGFATAAEVVVGSAVGSGKRQELLRAIKLTQRWGMAIGVVFSMVYWFGNSWILAWFTHHQEVLELAAVFMVWIIWEPLISNIPFILDGIFIGATGTKTMRNTMLFSVFLIYLPFFYLLSHFFGNHGMWAAIILLYMARAASLQFYIQRLRARPDYRLV